MKFQGAVVKEQGVTFAIVIVKQHIINSITERKNIQNSFSRFFTDMPIILMAQDFNGVPTYYGRNDIVKFLANIHVSQIPWKEYTVN